MARPRALAQRGRRTTLRGGAAARERAARRVLEAMVCIIGTLSVSTFNPGLIPPGLSMIQQVLTLGAWIGLIGASYAAAPAARLAFGTDAIALVAFYAYACCSVLWASQAPASLMKAPALCISAFGAYRVALALPVDRIVACMVRAYGLICAASLAVIVLAPGVGIDETWMHEGYWQGIFESKQALGSTTAVLIVFSMHRWTTGQIGSRQWLGILVAAGVLNVMSGSRDALGVAVLGCLALYGGLRFHAVIRILCVLPIALTVLAFATLGFLWTTGEPFIPLFGTKVDLTERVVIWAYALGHFGERPLAGFGLDGFWSRPEVLDAFNRQHGWVLDNYHDGYLAVLVETGLVGVALFTLTAVLFGLKALWLAGPGRMDPAQHRLMVVMVALLFFANLTESYFLRSTNGLASLTLIFMVLATRRGDAEPRSATGTGRPGGSGRVRPRSRIALRGAAVLLAVAAAACPAPTRAEQPDAAEPAFAAAAALGRGINILGYDGIWDGHRDNPFRLSDLRTIRAAGFDHVRINLFAFRHMDAAGRLDDTFLEALDSVVGGATAAGLIPLIDEHDNEFCQADPTGCVTKLKRFWAQIAARYAGRFPTLVFEVLNEPGGDMTATQWTRLANDVLAIIRASNPDRAVVISLLNGPDAPSLADLPLPATDRNIIVTVHYYSPFSFTFQGAPWEPQFGKLHDVSWGSTGDRAAVTRDFDSYAAWATARHRPLYLGEFGVYDVAPLAARVAYDGFVAASATARGWPWAYWQFDHDFALFDEARRRWNRPILDALMASRRPSRDAPPGLWRDRDP